MVKNKIRKKVLCLLQNFLSYLSYGAYVPWLSDTEMHSGVFKYTLLLELQHNLWNL